MKTLLILIELKIKELWWILPIITYYVLSKIFINDLINDYDSLIQDDLHLFIITHVLIIVVSLFFCVVVGFLGLFVSSNVQLAIRIAKVREKHKFLIGINGNKRKTK